MRKVTRRAVILVTAGALGLGGLAATAPALAGAVPFGAPMATATDPGPGWPGGMGGGAGMMNRDGSCLDPAGTAVKGTLTGRQQATLVAMAQNDKLAHDLYVAFADRHDVVIFDRIATAETRHLTAVRTLLDRYGLSDPTADTPAGRFSDPAVQATYDRLLAEGQAGPDAALRVGQQVEQADIDALRAALDGLTAPDVRLVYTRLLMSSQHHLAAFTR